MSEVQSNSKMNGEIEKIVVDPNFHENSSILPHLETWEKMMKIPVFESVVHQSEDVYQRVKCYTPMLNWALNTTENVLKNAVNISAPLVQKFDSPISYMDQQFVKTLDKIEQRAPIIREQPSEILNQAKAKVMDVVQPQIDKVCVLRKSGEKKAASLKELSYNKAKEVLATSYGAVCVSGIDSTAVLAERLLDSFFPRTNEDDDENDNDKPISVDDDPVLHTVQTIGRLNNKVARRVYRSISRQIQKLSRKEDLTDYIASLIAVLRLTQYLNFLHLTKVNSENVQMPEISNQAIAVK
jgi:perilipin-2